MYLTRLREGTNPMTSKSSSPSTIESLRDVETSRILTPALYKTLSDLTGSHFIANRNAEERDSHSH